MLNLIAELKTFGEDFEFYPTTNEIIHALIADLKQLKEGRYDGYGNRNGLTSVLDIGAGNGKVLRALRTAKYNRFGRDEDTCSIFEDFYAIEKSQILCEQLDPEVFIVGTEFHEQVLVTKSVDVTFCNPPYREFEEWTRKIIRETASKVIYLVIPVRWKNIDQIDAALKFRGAEASIIGEFSFDDAEDRTARALVNLVRVTMESPSDGNDPFEKFFDEQFAELKAKFDGTKTRPDRDGESKVEHDDRSKFSSLVVGPSYPQRIVDLYNAEMDHIRKNYDLVTKLDADLLKEFDVTPARILGCLRARLDGLRNTYWKELISNMSQVTNRLCSKQRQRLLDKLNQSGHVDFTLSNIHAVIIWILKNANQYLNEQLIETFEQMVEKANVRNYVSNTRAFTYDRWRYNEEKPSYIALEYMLVLDRCGGITKGYAWEKSHRIDGRGQQFLGDLLTVARNLGFDSDGRAQLNEEWKTGEKRIFAMAKEYKVGDKVLWTGTTRKRIADKVQLENGSWQYKIDGEWVHEACLPREPLLEARAYYNSNIHVRLNQKFALALNVEYGRLKGWLKSGAEAVDELGDKDAARYFDSHLKLGPGALLMLAGPAESAA